MSLDLTTRYPGQIDTSDATGYPYGKAQNIVVPGDGVGTPWEKDLVNDLFGFQQALLDAASITPSGTPDKVGTSQYLEALETLYVNGLTGGTWAPSSEIEIAGAGLRMTGDLNVDGLVTSSGTAYYQFDNASAQGNITIDAAGLVFDGIGVGFGGLGAYILTGGKLYVQDGAEVEVQSGGIVDLQAGSTTNIAGAVDIAQATATLTGGVAIATAFEIGGTGIVGISNDWQFESGGSLDFRSGSALQALAGSTFTVETELELSGGGKIRHKVLNGGDADATYTLAQCDHLWVPGGTLTADRNYTISSSGAAEGSVMDISRRDDGSAFTITLKRDDTTTIVPLDSAGVRSTKLIYTGGQWEVFHQVNN